MDVKDIIKDIRLKAKKTQEEFADSINVSRGTISQIEGGRANPTYEILEKIINVYSLDANVFFKKDIPNYLPNDIPNVNNISFNDSLIISENDLKILNSITYFPSLDDINKYLNMNDKQIKLVITELYESINTKIKTLESVNTIAKILNIKSKGKFIELNTKDYTNDALKDYDPKEWDDSFSFESTKIYNLVKIYALNEALEQLDFILANQIDYLLKQCSYNIKRNIISINDNL